jgi:hypothetical protein
MTPVLPSPLPAFDRRLLALSARLVPAAQREDWLRCWQAELWHSLHHSLQHPARQRSSTPGLHSGLFRDALWLRGESCRLTLQGTALLCLAILLTLVAIAALPCLYTAGSWQAFLLTLAGDLPRFLCEATLIVFVGFASGQQTIAHTARRGALAHLRSTLFLAAKTVLVLTFAFLITTDLCQPFSAFLPFTSALLQNLVFVLIALVGLRWSLADQGQRCKHCLRALSNPARVGRPSWNFLDSNGTELLCPQGHGRLSVPEIQTSWRRSSEWLAVL